MRPMCASASVRRPGPVAMRSMKRCSSRYAAALPSGLRSCEDRRGNRAKLDLKAFVKQQTAQIGIDREHITTVNLCTICHPHLFFSYRREGRVNGTMLNGITLMPHW